MEAVLVADQQTHQASVPHDAAESIGRAPTDAPSDPPPGPGVSILADGRLRMEGLTPQERTWSQWMHLSLFATALVLPPMGCVLPIILWLIRREKSAFIDDHGTEIANLVITGALATLTLMWIPIIGWIPLAAWYIVAAINAVRGAIAASRSECFRYPMVIRILS